MHNDKVCPECGGLMIYTYKHFPDHTYYFYLCLHCGNIEIVGWSNAEIII